MYSLSKPVKGVVVKCSRCGQPAVARIPYAKLNLCSLHFTEYLENRVVSFARRWNVGRVKNVLLALSGGKDSLSLAVIATKRKDELGFQKLIGFHIDLGIGEYSRLSRSAVEKLCHKLGLACVVSDLKSLIGFSLPELVLKVKRPPCSLCGLLRRYILNAASVEIGVDAVALGHHMDDILVFALKNILIKGDIGEVKMTPLAKGIEGFLSTRIKLLYEVYEDDLKLYADLSNIEYVTTECPYKHVDFITYSVRNLLENLENYNPGFKIALIRRLTRKEAEEAPAGLKQCRICGLPSSHDICGVCRLTAKVVGMPLGPQVRAGLRTILERIKD